MTAPTAHHGPPVRTRRIVIFRGLTILWLALLAFAIPNLLTPWVDVDFQHDGVIQGWRDAVEGAVDTLVWVAVLGLVLKPLERPLVAQFAAVGAVIAATVVAAAGPAMLVTIALLLLPVLSYPRPSLLADRRAPERDTFSAVVAVLAAAVLLPLAVAAWSATDRQAATYAEHLVLLAVAGLAVASRRPGWRWMAWPTIGAWSYLGVVAMAFPGDLDSFGLVGGLACLVVAVAFAVAQVRTLTTDSARSPQPAAEGIRPTR